MTIETKCHWDSIILIGEDAKSELLYWNANLCSLNGRPFVLDKVCTAEVLSDASSIGYGGYVAEIDGSESIGCCSGLESKQSSTWREHKTVLYVLQRIGGDLIGRTIKWKVDNINVVHIMRKGSMKVKLQNIALNIMECCKKYDIIIIPEWIPRNLNIHADWLSRLPYKDADDWSVNVKLFYRLDQKWGPFTVDRFATSYNAKCVRLDLIQRYGFWELNLWIVSALTGQEKTTGLFLHQD
jgi:hypothetical protein